MVSSWLRAYRRDHDGGARDWHDGNDGSGPFVEDAGRVQDTHEQVRQARDGGDAGYGHPFGGLTGREDDVNDGLELGRAGELVGGGLNGEDGGERRRQVTGDRLFDFLGDGEQGHSPSLFDLARDIDGELLFRFDRLPLPIGKLRRQFRDLDFGRGERFRGLGIDG